MIEPMYTASSTLDVNLTFHAHGQDYDSEVSGDLEHAMLYAGMRQFRKNYLLGCPKGAATLNSVNFLNASIGILGTDAFLDEGDPGELELISFPYRLEHRKNKHLFRTMDLYDPDTNYLEEGVYITKAGRNHTFNDHLKLHISNARLDKLHNTFTVQTDIDEEKRDSQFHENFHHTEQGFLHSLYEVDSMESICAMIKTQKRFNSIVGIFMDLHTVRPMCACCNLGVIGAQNSAKQGFMADFVDYAQYALEDELYYQFPDKGLMLRMRVSCTQKNADTEGLHYDLQKTLSKKQTAATSKVLLHHKRSRQVIQTYVDTGKHQEIIEEHSLSKKIWREDIFVSSQVPDKRYDKLMKNKAPK